MVKYMNDVKETEKDLNEDALKEFNYRRTHIDRRSKEGKDKYKELPLDELPSFYPKTKFTELNNICISSKFRCDDRGIFVYGKDGYERICEAVSIDAIFKDENGDEYINIQYIDSQKDELKTLLFPSSNIATNNYNDLMAKGIIIDNPKMFTKYINEIRTVEKEMKQLSKGKAEQKYGFPLKEDGTVDFSRFIGLGKDKIISAPEFSEIDDMVFKKRGCYEGFMDFLEEVSKGKYMFDFQLMIAASLSGVLLAVLNRNSIAVAPPSFIFYGPTSIGKNLLVTLASIVWGSPTRKNPLICNSDSSKAFMMEIKDHLYTLPIIIEDLQDIIDKLGVEATNELVFNHSYGYSGGRAKTSGKIREVAKTWVAPLIACAEGDSFSASGAVSGGTSARYTLIDLQCPKGKTLTEKPLQSYLTEEFENSGWLGEYFINDISKKDVKEIDEIFNTITENLKGLGMAEKQANSFSVLLTTLRLMYESSLMPESWLEQPMTEADLIEWIAIRDIKTPEEEVYELVCQTVLRDVSYMPSDNERFHGTKEEFDFKSKTTSEVRGRLYYERLDKETGEYKGCLKGERDRTLLIIPAENLKKLFTYIIKENNITGFGFSQESWHRNGWLLKANSNTYLFKGFKKLAITRPYDSRARESVYAIVVKEE